MTDETTDTAPTVLEHDPDSGCEGCPFAAWYETGRSYHCLRLDCWAGPPLDEPSEPAPDTCPLRAGGVLVRAVRR